MEFTPQVHHRLNQAGILFGIALATTLLWTTQIAPVLTLRNVPIDAGSYGINPASLALIIGLNLGVITLGAYLVARMWERSWAALLAAGIASMLAQVGTAYLITLASLEGNSFAELIMFQLPVGLIFGGLVWFAGGILGGGIERLVLGWLANLFQHPQRWLLGFALALVVGALMGLLAGGSNEQREASTAAARAVETAIRETTGKPVPADLMPMKYSLSGPARRALETLRDQGDAPYRIVFLNYDGREVVTVVRYDSGASLRCVSTGPVISRCFREN